MCTLLLSRLTSLILCHWNRLLYLEVMQALQNVTEEEEPLVTLSSLTTAVDAE